MKAIVAKLQVRRYVRRRRRPAHLLPRRDRGYELEGVAGFSKVRRATRAKRRQPTQSAPRRSRAHRAPIARGPWRRPARRRRACSPSMRIESTSARRRSSPACSRPPRVRARAAMPRSLGTASTPSASRRRTCAGATLARLRSRRASGTPPTRSARAVSSRVRARGRRLRLVLQSARRRRRCRGGSARSCPPASQRRIGAVQRRPRACGARA